MAASLSRLPHFEHDADDVEGEGADRVRDVAHAEGDSSRDLRAPVAAPKDAEATDRGCVTAGLHNGGGKIKARLVARDIRVGGVRFCGIKKEGTSSLGESA